ncbi:MAG: pentapeptide repeat-containing protein [Nostoc sp. ChiSLP01]
MTGAVLKRTILLRATLSRAMLIRASLSAKNCRLG